MKTMLFYIAFLFFSDKMKSPIIDPLKHDQSLCRMTCTVYVDTGLGYEIGLSQSAGGLFTSCENALEKACAKVGEEAYKMALNML